MLNSMLDEVLDPAALSDFEGLGLPEILCQLLPDDTAHDLAGASGLAFESGAARLEVVTLFRDLGAELARFWDGADYSLACQIASSEQHERAAAAFLAVAARSEERYAALFGLASQLHHLGRDRQARKVAVFLTELGGEEPRAFALLGAVEGALGKHKEARLHLSRAAHLSRGERRFQTVLRFTQKKLLQQHFSDRVDRGAKKTTREV